MVPESIQLSKLLAVKIVIEAIGLCLFLPMATVVISIWRGVAEGPKDGMWIAYLVVVFGLVLIAVGEWLYPTFPDRTRAPSDEKNAESGE